MPAAPWQKQGERSGPPPRPPTCGVCADRGLIFLGSKPRNWGAARDVSAMLSAERAALCTCEWGQWWLSWITALNELEGTPLPAAGVPEGLAEGAAALSWLDRWTEQSATC